MVTSISFRGHFIGSDQVVASYLDLQNLNLEFSEKK